MTLIICDGAHGAITVIALEVTSKIVLCPIRWGILCRIFMSLYLGVILNQKAERSNKNCWKISPFLFELPFLGVIFTFYSKNMDIISPFFAVTSYFFASNNFFDVNHFFCHIYLLFLKIQKLFFLAYELLFAITSYNIECDQNNSIFVSILCPCVAM